MARTGRSTAVLLLAVAQQALAAKKLHGPAMTRADSVVAQSGSREVYTENGVCIKQYCINPVFPGLEDLHRLEQKVFHCAPLRSVAPDLGFCRAAVNYDVALPQAETPADASIEAAVRKQERAAMTTFMLHLSAMGMDGWDYTQPELSSSDCVKSVWRMLCYTYFPRAKVGCKEGETTQYFRPCQSSCQNYVRTCKVECCDESVRCVFTHKKPLTPTTAIITKGYLPFDGPSSLCTGSAWRSRAPQSTLLGLLLLLPLTASGSLGSLLRALAGASGRVALLAVLAAVALVLQGWDLIPTGHKVGNWRAEPDYLIAYEFVPPGFTAAEAVINSCTLQGLAQPLQCGGRGTCKLLRPDKQGNPAPFCFCDRDWADPECRTRRKSQLVAFLLALFFGNVGADQFYLGYVPSGLLKLAALSSWTIWALTEMLATGTWPVQQKDLGNPLGLLKCVVAMLFVLWYVMDVLRAGSAPVQALRFRTAADLPHWAFVIVVVSVAIAVGFFFSYLTVMERLAERRKQGLLLTAQEEARGLASSAVPHFGHSQSAQGYGSVNLPARASAFGASNF